MPAPSRGEALTETSAVDRVHQALRERILSGVYEPGSRLVLARLSDQHGVSLIPIREALRQLEAERLVVLETNRGARVSSLSLEDMNDIYETRVALERHALLRAAPRLDQDRLSRAGQELEAMAAALEAEDGGLALVHHRLFHFALYEPGASPWTMHLIDQLWRSAERYLRLAPGLRSSGGEFVAEHIRVLEAIGAGDPARAADLLETNLRTTAALLAAQLEPGDGDGDG